MATRKFHVILENAPDCELARETVELNVDGKSDADIDDMIDAAATDAIAGMVLSIGDTIKIVDGDE